MSPFDIVDPPKTVRLESYSTLYNSETRISRCEQCEAKAIEEAKAFDQRRYIPPEDSLVQRRKDVVDSSPDVFLHTNKRQYLNELLLEEYQKEIQDGVMRIFLECLYGKVGFVQEYPQPKRW